jgi:hypothetical protein
MAPKRRAQDAATPRRHTPHSAPCAGFGQVFWKCPIVAKLESKEIRSPSSPDEAARCMMTIDCSNSRHNWFVSAPSDQQLCRLEYKIQRLA